MTFGKRDLDPSRPRRSREGGEGRVRGGSDGCQSSGAPYQNMKQSPKGSVWKLVIHEDALDIDCSPV